MNADKVSARTDPIAIDANTAATVFSINFILILSYLS